MLQLPQLDLTVQDYFFEYQIPPTRAPISPAQWMTWFQTWLGVMESSSILLAQGTNTYEICLRLTDDVEIQRLNYQYRHQDCPTDVLAFAALEGQGPLLLDPDFPFSLGDIIIAVPTAQAQAQSQKHSLATELAWLAVHGFLHLLGWEHPDSQSLEQMLKQQWELLHLSQSPQPRYYPQ
jgi:probable rRNA maturation factor